MTKTPLEKKLRLHDGYSVFIINSPRNYEEFFGSFPEDVAFFDQPEAEVDFVHLFIRSRSELDKYIDVALRSIKYDGLLWISYPKGSSRVDSDVNRDILWDLLLEKGIRPVTQISIDDTWSAIRFRPQDAVGKQGDR